MKTTLSNIAMTIGLTAVLGSAALVASITSRGMANIPFDFQVGAKTMPAGKYSVSRDAQSSATQFQNLSNGHTALLLTYAGKSARGEAPKLMFNRGANGYTLSEIWFPGGAIGYLAPAGKQKSAARERGLAAMVPLHK